MTDPTMTTTVHLIECPACHKPITARITAVVTLDGGALPVWGTAATATVRVTGARVDHDCIERTSR